MYSVDLLTSSRFITWSVNLFNIFSLIRKVKLFQIVYVFEWRKLTIFHGCLKQHYKIIAFHSWLVLCHGHFSILVRWFVVVLMHSAVLPRDQKWNRLTKSMLNQCILFIHTTSFTTDASIDTLIWPLWVWFDFVYKFSWLLLCEDFQVDDNISDSIHFGRFSCCPI